MFFIVRSPRCCLSLFEHVFDLYPLVLFCRVIWHRWRSDTSDNSGPCGVNRGAIARSSVSLFAAIYQHISLFTERHTGAQRRTSLKALNMCCCVGLYHTLCACFTILNSWRWFKSSFSLIDEDKHQSQRGDNDFCDTSISPLAVLREKPIYPVPLCSHCSS